MDLREFILKSCMGPESRREIAEIEKFEPKRVFVCFDGSENSIRALGTAISMASRYESQILVAHAIPFFLNVYDLGEFSYEWETFQKSERKRIGDILKPYVEEAGKMNLDVRVTYLTGKESTPDSLLQESEKRESDIIIIGSRGLGGFEGLKQGSISQAVAAFSKVPVLIVK